jgi:diadenosine tetraphosphate (Ap4A) HIT family hydrolase
MDTLANPDCPFCNIDGSALLFSDELIACIWDQYPVSPGHILLVTRQHVKTWFAASNEQQQALIAAIGLAKAAIEALHCPDGYNIGVNSGEAGGQTIEHLHLHIIPRYLGDDKDPRGGIRKVLPEKAKYW